MEKSVNKKNLQGFGNLEGLCGFYNFLCKNRSGAPEFWKKGIKFLLFFLAIILMLPGCSKVYIHDEKLYERPEYSELPREHQEMPVPEKDIKIRQPEEHEIEEYDITDKSPPKKPPQIGAQRDVRPPQHSYMLAGVVRLMDKAKQQMALEYFDQAFATTERALRIDPSNASLWSLLAEIQLKRGNVSQAVQLSKKSNLLAKRNRALQAKNWRIIAEALHRKGATAEAEKADLKAQELEAQQ